MIREKPVYNKNEDVSEIAKNVLETLLDRLGVAATVTPQAKSFVEGEEGSPVPITLDIEGGDLGILIGRRGQTLSCLEYIVRLIVAHQTNAWSPIFVDVEGYRQRHYKALQSLAWRMAEQVKIEGMSFSLEPMSAYERRIIHLALVDDQDVTTQSIGEGEARKVVILPKGQA